MNRLAAFLFDRTERDPIPRGLESDLLFKLELGARQQVFADLRFPFWNGPRPVVLVFPKWAARMNEQEFDQAGVGPTKHEQTGTGVTSFLRLRRARILHANLERQ